MSLRIGLGTHLGNARSRNFGSTSTKKKKKQTPVLRRTSTFGMMMVIMDGRLFMDRAVGGIWDLYRATAGDWISFLNCWILKRAFVCCFPLSE